MFCKEMRGEPEGLSPVLNNSQARLREKGIKTSSAESIQETSAKISEGVKSRIKYTASGEKTENGMKAVTELDKSLKAGYSTLT